MEPQEADPPRRLAPSQAGSTEPACHSRTVRKVRAQPAGPPRLPALPSQRTQTGLPSPAWLPVRTSHRPRAVGWGAAAGSRAQGNLLMSRHQRWVMHGHSRLNLSRPARVPGRPLQQHSPCPTLWPHTAARTTVRGAQWERRLVGWVGCGSHSDVDTRQPHTPRHAAALL